MTPLRGIILTQQVQYIALNGDYILPSIAQNVINKFGSYFTLIN